MQQTKLKWIALLLLSFAIIGLKAQNSLNVHNKLNTKTSFAVSAIQKLIISGGNLTINKKDATTNTYLLTDVAYLDFSSINTANIANETDNQFVLYPNPVQDILNSEYPISSKSDIIKLDIIGIDGKTILSETPSNGKISISLTSLSKGIYFCRFNNGNKVTTTKFIKQ
jgi:hypothetical protein